MGRTLLIFLAAVALCVALTTPLSARQDEAYHSLVASVAPESHGAVALSRGLPSAQDLAEAQGMEDQLRSELEAWWESWALEEGRGARVRGRLYGTLSQHLYPLLNDHGLAELLSRNGEILRGAEQIGLVLDQAKVEGALHEAIRLQNAATAALGEGRGALALGLALESSDALRSVNPGEVAQGLIRRAHEALGRFSPPGPYSEEEMTRILRLTRGASEALDEEDYPRAIRRAYYACQLLGAESG